MKLNYLQALQKLENGEKIRRTDWHKNLYIYKNIEDNYIYDAKGNRWWAALQAMRNTEWEIYDPVTEHLQNLNNSLKDVLDFKQKICDRYMSCESCPLNEVSTLGTTLCHNLTQTSNHINAIINN